MQDVYKSLLVGSLALWITFVELPALSQPAPLYSYTNSPRVEIHDIHGIVELWHITEQCWPEVVSGTIESIEFSPDAGETPKAFRLRMSDGFVEWVGLNAIAEGEFSMIDLAWIGKFFTPGRKVLVAGARCGAAGHELLARDIYDAKYITSIIGAIQKR